MFRHFKTSGKIKKAAANNSSYAMRVSEVLQVQFPQARFVTGDRDVATKSPTAHSRGRWQQNKKTNPKR